MAQQDDVPRRKFLGAAGAGALAAIVAPGLTGTPASSAEAQPATLPATTRQARRPNIVIILADDMGYGDVVCYDPEHAKIPTPCIDRLASQGMRFTDAHTTSPVCSPTRYSLLTGRYHWRAGIRAALPKWAGPAIRDDRLTLPKLLHRQSYHTACIGKWHLGFDWPRTDGRLDFTKPLKGGPMGAGFDRYFGVDVPNYPPFTFIANDQITVQPTEHCTIDKEMIVNHEGPMAPGWRFDRIVPTLVEKSIEYINEQSTAGKPFLLYLALTSPHYPIAPSEAFKGRSGINPLADFMIETDAVVGAIDDSLQRNGVAGDTLLIFLTDNGHDPTPGLEAFERAGHRVSGPLRGVKFAIEEGGHRVPFIARWEPQIQPNSICDVPISVTDLFATCAEVAGSDVPGDAAEDSTSILPLLLGRMEGYAHPAIVQHSPENAFAIRRGDWKLTVRPPAKDAMAKIELYNLRTDLNETRNVADENPELVKELTELLQRFVNEGRSTAGPRRENDAPVHVPT